MPKASSQRRLPWLVAAVFLLSAAVSSIPLIRQFGLRLTDSYLRTAPLPKFPSDVVLVLIDDESLARHGRWPWSRTKLANLVTTLSRSGAQVIGLDILLSEPQSADTDAQLAAAIRDSGRVVLVDKIAAYSDGQSRWIDPLRVFEEASLGLGHAQAVLDGDGVCRRFPPRELSVDGVRLAFALETAKRIDAKRTAEFLELYGIAEDSGRPVIRAGPVLIPIAYRGDGFQRLSAADVLANRNLERVRGHPVLVGFGTTELADRLSTPLTSALPSPGVEVHAQILDSVLTGRFVKAVPAAVNLLLLLFASVGAVLVFRKMRGWESVLQVMLLSFAIYFIGWIAYALSSWMLSVGPPIIAAVAAPLVVQADHLFEVNRSLSRQVDSLREWLRQYRRLNVGVQDDDIASRLAVLQQLQTELGSLYELHESLLDATSDAIGIFDRDGALLLQNGTFAKLFESGTYANGLDSVRAHLEWTTEAPEVEYPHGKEGEARVARGLYVVRTVSFGATRLAPSGGTILLLTSLKAREERDRSRAEALAFVTHELRTPLTSIQGFAELMMRYPDSPSSERAPGTIYRESKRMLALIHCYLDVLRIDAGARPLDRKPVQLRDVVRQVFELVLSSAEAECMTLRHDGDEFLIVEADEVLLHGALLNLVSNAVKYGHPGGVITVSWMHDETGTTLTVRNFSEDLQSDELPILFDTFSRGSNVDTRPGWGIGLAFVRRIAEKHGGSLSAEYRDDQLDFTIHLPAPMAVAAVKEGAR
jgi:CHASE2 domain-containing sensor protein/two-component sensor histidine kinase